MQAAVHASPLVPSTAPGRMSHKTQALVVCSCAGHTIAWTLWFLCQNPGALAKLEAELDAAGLMKGVSNPSPRQFTFNDIGHLKWLDACIKASSDSSWLASDCAQRMLTSSQCLPSQPPSLLQFPPGAHGS